MSEDNIKAIIEALLFVNDKPLTLERIKEVLDNMETTHIRVLLEELGSEYERANRGMRIIEIAGGFQMVTAPIAVTYLKKLYKERKAEKLSRPALETLAIVAYKQPITKREIEAIRDVEVDGIIRNLLDKGIIRISGRKKAPGRPHVFGTTRQFLEYFGLKSLEELPKIENFPQAIPIKENDDEVKNATPTNR
jgi:segregation and condensation protein B